MAIGTPVSLGSNTVLSTGVTLVVTVGTAVSAGDTVVCGGGTTASGALASVADSKGNTYVVDKTSAALRGCGIASSVIGTALAVNDTITLSYTNNVSSRRSGWAASVSGLSSGADKTNTNSNATSAAWDGATTGTLTQANEIAWGCGYRAAAGTSTPGTNFTELFDFANSDTTSAVYQIVSATTAVTPGGTWSGSGNQWEAETVTYKASSATAVRQSVFVSREAHRRSTRW